MKRAIALMMCVAMIVVTLSGCTEAELGFLSQLQRQGQNVEGTFSNTLEIDIDKNVLKDLFNDMRKQLEEAYGSGYEPVLASEAPAVEEPRESRLNQDQEEELEALLIKYGGEGSLSEEEYQRLEELLYSGEWENDYDYSYIYGNMFYYLISDTLEAAIEGLDLIPGKDEKIHIALSYSGKRQLGEDGGLRIRGWLEVNGWSVDLGEVFVKNDGGLYLSAKFVKGLNEIAKALDLQWYTDSYLDALELIAKENKFIYLDIYGEFFDAGEMNHSLTSAVSELLLSFYSDAFSEFSTGRVRKVSGGYELDLNLEQYVRLMDSALEYVIKNEERYFEAYEDYAKNIASLVQNSSFETAVTDAPKLSEEEREEYKAALTVAREALRSQYGSAWLRNYGQSGIRVFLKGSGSGSRQSELELSLVFQGNTALSFKAVSSVQEKGTAIRFPVQFIAGDQLESQLEKQLLALNPPIGAEIYFGLDDFNEEGNTFAMWQLLREDYGYFYEMTYLTDEEGRQYVPLRAIAEPLQIQLIWDEEAKHSQPVIDGAVVKVDGIVHQDIFYMEISQFEKLGYLVKDAADGYGGVVILSQEDPAWEEWYDYLIGA